MTYLLIGRSIFGDSKVLKKEKEDHYYFSHTDPKSASKYASPTKPPKISTMTQEKIEKISLYIEEVERKWKTKWMRWKIYGRFENVHVLPLLTYPTVETPKGDIKMQGNDENVE